MKRRPWAAAEVAILREQYPHTRTDDLAVSLARPTRAVYQKAHGLGLRKSDDYLASPDAHRLDGVKGIGTRFAKGVAPWNKGKRFVAGGRSAETRFKKGNYSTRWDRESYAVGALRINSDGALDIKFREGQRAWMPLSRFVWERERGPIPKGMAVRYINGDPHDARIENLRLATRAELMRENTYHNYPKEVALAIQLRGALIRQINKRDHGKKHREPA